MTGRHHEGARGEDEGPPCCCATVTHASSSSVPLTCTLLSINPARHESHSQVISISLPHMLSGVASVHHHLVSSLTRSIHLYIYLFIVVFFFLGKPQSSLQMPCLSSEHGGKSSRVRLPGGRVHRGAFRRGPGGYRYVCVVNQKAVVTFVRRFCFLFYARRQAGRANDGCHVGRITHGHQLCYVQSLYH